MEITKKIYSEISAGELFDKITILEIKKIKIKDRSKRNIVLKELGSLQETVNNNIKKSKSLINLYKKLKSVNLKLWKIEDNIRDCERKRNFGKIWFVEQEGNKISTVNVIEILS